MYGTTIGSKRVNFVSERTALPFAVIPGQVTGTLGKLLSGCRPKAQAYLRPRGRRHGCRRDVLAAPDGRPCGESGTWAILGLFLVWALCCGELASFERNHLQLREGRWVLDHARANIVASRHNQESTSFGNALASGTTLAALVWLPISCELHQHGIPLLLQVRWVEDCVRNPAVESTFRTICVPFGRNHVPERS